MMGDDHGKAAFWRHSSRHRRRRRGAVSSPRFMRQAWGIAGDLDRLHPTGADSDDQEAGSVLTSGEG